MLLMMTMLIGFRWEDGSSRTLRSIGWEGYDEEDTGTSSETSAFSITGKVNTITAEVVAKYLGLDRSKMTPQKCTSLRGMKQTVTP